MENPSLWGELNVHDPAVIKDGAYYYVFSTDASLGNIHNLGIQIRRSKDLVTWEYRGTAFRDFEKDAAELIAYAGLNPQNKEGLWAPDIIKINGTYRLYGSASTFGSRRSCIFLAESKKIEGPYTYRGMVVQSAANSSGPNAIDPALVYSKEGRLYLAYGSFFGGLYLAELDKKSGFLKEGGPVKIAGGNHAAVEGPAITYFPETGYYYLFASYGSLSRDYNIRAARSRRIEGPYLDARGRDMNSPSLVRTGKAGVKLMGGFRFGPGSGGSKAPGHNSVLSDGEDRFILHHTRSYALPDYWFTMNVRRIALNRSGWPVVSPLRYRGEALEAAALPGGDYLLIEHGESSAVPSPAPLSLRLESGVITGSRQGSYRLYDGFRMELILDGGSYDGVVFRQAGPPGQERWAFSLMSEEGLCVWGLRAEDPPAGDL